MPPQFEVAARTHRGLVRASNQDAVLVLEQPQAPIGIHVVAAVADGMGGLPAGDVASRLAIDAFRDRLTSRPAPAEPENLLRQAFSDANDAVHRDAHDTAAHRGMGTTLTVAMAVDGELLVAHVGDSRAYLLRSGQLRQLTVDDTWVQAGLDAGTLTPEQAAVHPYRHMLTGGLGLDAQVDVHLYREPLLTGDVVLACTDGLHGELNRDRIAELLSEGTALETARSLEEAALSVSGRDNVTLAIFRVLQLAR